MGPLARLADGGAADVAAIMAKAHIGQTELRKASLKRKRDAWALLKQGRLHARGAAYLGGYAIECKLKALAMEVHDCWTLDQLRAKRGLAEADVYTHGLEALAMTAMPAGFYRRLRESRVWRDFAEVNAWRPDWRYDPNDWTKAGAERFLTAVDRVYQWLESNTA